MRASVIDDCRRNRRTDLRQTRRRLHCGCSEEVFDLMYGPRPKRKETMLEALAKGQTPAAEIEAGLPQRPDVNASSTIAKLHSERDKVIQIVSAATSGERI
jgi:hypothetical protein